MHNCTLFRSWVFESFFEFFLLPSFFLFLVFRSTHLQRVVGLVCFQSSSSLSRCFAGFEAALRTACCCRLFQASLYAQESSGVSSSSRTASRCSSCGFAVAQETNCKEADFSVTRCERQQAAELWTDVFG